MSELVVGRLVALAIASAIWGICFLYYKAITRYRSQALKRSVLGLLCIGAFVSLLFAQISAFSSITGLRRPIDDDPFFFWLGIFESGIPLGALFFFLIQKRRLDDLEWVYKTSFLRFVIRFGAVRIGLLGGVLFFPFAPQQSG